MRVLLFILVIFTASISAQMTFEKASQLAKNENYEQALEIYKQVLLKTETETSGESLLAKIHFNIGICQYHLNQTKEAVASFKQAIVISGEKYQKAFYALGMAQTELENWREAESAFLNCLKLKKDDGEAWFDLALIFLEEQNYESAEKAFFNSIKYKSIASADAHNNIGVIFMIQGKYVFAENEFQMALKISNGNSIEAESNLKFCLFYKQSEGKNLIANLKLSRRSNDLGV